LERRQRIGTNKRIRRKRKISCRKTFNNGQLDVASVKIYTPTNNTINPNQEPIQQPEVIKEVKTNQNKDIGVFTGNGHNVTYTKDRKIEREGDWKDGKLIDGKRYYYDESGKLTKTSVYKNGNIVNIIYPD